jgi:hypothetical protein
VEVLVLIVRKSIRRAAVVLAAAAAAATATLLPAAPALAQPSGLGWSASWRYYDPKGIESKMSAPGALMETFISDNGAERWPVPTLFDTDDKDGLCAIGRIYADGTGMLGEGMVCDGQKATSFPTISGHGVLLMFVYRAEIVDGRPTYVPGLVRVEVPDPAEDPDLRTVGTGASWSYYTDDSFEFTLERPGMRYSGYGVEAGGGYRSIVSVLENTGTSKGCATSKVWDANSKPLTGSVCAAGKDQSLHRNNLEPFLAVQACYQPSGNTNRCLFSSIPELV